MTDKKFLFVVMCLQIAASAALYISNDTRVEITCTGRGLSGLPEWSINGTTVTAHGATLLRSLGIAIIPESVLDARDDNDNFFQTLVINGSAAVYGTTIECVFDGEEMFPTTELVFLVALPPPENLAVSEGGLVQWQPPYSSLETEAVRYFLYNIRYSVEVTNTLTQETIVYDETDTTSFGFQPLADCTAYIVTVTAHCHTSVGDPAAVNMDATGVYALPEPVVANDITTTLQGNTLTVTVTAQYELTCNRATSLSIIYNGQHYIMQATLEIELIVGACSFDVLASNPAGNSVPTRVTIDDCGGTSEEPTLKFETSNQNISLIAGVVAAVGSVLLSLAIVAGILIVVLRIKRNNKVLDYEKSVHSNTHHEQKPEQITEKRKADTPTGYIPIQSQPSNASQPSPESSLSSTSSTSPRTNSTSCDSSPPSSPLEAPNNEKYDLVKPEEEKYAELAVLRQKTKCVQPPDEGVIYSGIQHPKQDPKQPVYADVALQKPKCSPPAAGSAEPVLYSLVQLQEQV